MKKYKRRLWSLVLSLVMLFSISIPVTANDENQADTIVVTEEIIIEIAENFASNVSELPLQADNPIKYYDESGQAIGYIVNYYYSGSPHGYVIFDNTHEDFISEYVMEENARNPYEVIVEYSEETDEIESLDQDDEILYRIEPFTYGIVDTDEQIVNNYGEVLEDASEYVEEVPEEVVSRRSSSKPGHWNEILVDMNVLYQDYTVTSSRNLSDFHAISESYIESVTGRYGCAVSAMWACASYYNTVNWSDIRGDYLLLWNLSATTTDHTSNGIIYGSTNQNNTGNGLVEFCRTKGVTIRHTFSTNPSYSFFTNCINSGNIAIFHGGLNTTSGRSGHAMAVQGYATVQKKNSSSTMQTLMVFDGWYEQVRFLNFNYSYLDTHGNAFSR